VTVLEVRAGERSTRVTLDDDGGVRVGNAPFDVESIGDGQYRVSNGERAWLVAVAGTGDDRWVFVDGAVYQVEVGPAGQARRRAAAGHDLSSPMPATVVRVLVEPGATVARGDTLIMLEAMKMELAIRAPRDGVVGAVHCRPGDLVPPGRNLLDLA
jgi:3-methylcrotonyl-CoA carboxylase alpha subunit